MSESLEIQLARAKSESSLQRDLANGGDLVKNLAQMVRDASAALPYRERYPGGDFRGEPQRVAAPAAAGISAPLGAVSLPGLFDRNGRIRRIPGAVDAGQTVRLDAALVSLSRVAQAGALVIVQPEATRAIPLGKGATDVAFVRHPKYLRNTQPAPFQTMPSEVDVGYSQLPTLSAEIDFSTRAIQKAAAFKITRAERREMDSDMLASEIALSLVLGLANAADEVFLSALADTAPAFSFGAAASKGLKFAELSALIGTTGAGASVNQGGFLTASGIPAELTASTAETYIGAFQSAGIAVHEMIDVHAKRTDGSGSLEITAFAQFVPVIPDPDKFWKAGA